MRTAIELRAIVNQVIHNFIFMFVHDEKGVLNGLFVASDREKAKCLHFIKLSALVRAFRAVARDDVAQSHWARDRKTGDWIVKNYRE